jgi:AcrR family transcriptional regulator
MPNRRTTLLRQSMDYLLAHGVASLSLRRLAAALGTSARMLVYHFHSRDELIIAVMAEVRSRFQASHEAAFARRRPGAVHPLLVFWESLLAPANLARVRLLFEVQILALQNPSVYSRYLDQASTSWLEVIERALSPAIRSRTTAALCSAVVDGLLLDVLSTGEQQRATEALELFLKQLWADHRSVERRKRVRKSVR